MANVLKSCSYHTVANHRQQGTVFTIFNQLLNDPLLTNGISYPWHDSQSFQMYRVCCGACLCALCERRNISSRLARIQVKLRRTREEKEGVREGERKWRIREWRWSKGRINREREWGMEGRRREGERGREEWRWRRREGERGRKTSDECLESLWSHAEIVFQTGFLLHPLIIVSTEEKGHTSVLKAGHLECPICDGYHLIGSGRFVVVGFRWYIHTSRNKTIKQ